MLIFFVGYAYYFISENLCDKLDRKDIDIGENDMKKCICILLILFISTTSIALAIPANDNSQADEHNPVITIVDPVRGIAKAEFIHHDKGYQKNTVTSSFVPGSGTCWGTFATWNNSLPVRYVINPNNPQGLGSAFITSAISTSAETWDAATSKELFRDTYTIDSRARYGKLDGKNSIVFGATSPGTIAVTSTWYYTSTRQIIEFDMKFNTYYTWGNADLNSRVMDLQNIATHELGHSVGMNDIYTSSCSDVTMYGYGDSGETKKRTLEPLDIEGLLSLYP